MTATFVGYQASLLDAGDDVTAVRELGPTVERHRLGDGAWLDIRRGWIGGADQLFDRLHASVAWQAEQRVMYDRLLAGAAAARVLRRARPVTRSGARAGPRGARSALRG